MDDKELFKKLIETEFSEKEKIVLILDTLKKTSSKNILDKLNRAPQQSDESNSTLEAINIYLLLIDIVNYSTLYNEDSTNIVRQVEREYLSIILNTCNEYNGTFEKHFLGRILCFFTQPKSVLLSAEQIRKKINNSFDAFNNSYKLELGLRLVLHYGRVFFVEVGNPLRKENVMMGDDIKYSYKLLDEAVPGSILITDVTYEQFSAMQNLVNKMRPTNNDYFILD